MADGESKKLTFDVETSRILEILSREIYDSPYALLRENTQNAYDAILMRLAKTGGSVNDAMIEITIKESQVVISDDGIGMDESVLVNNFWRAGSSGKNSREAVAAGVVGTFGIGAMANFGVAERLQVETRPLGGAETLVSVAERANLKIARECVDLRVIKDGRDVGTTVIADLDAAHRLSAEQAKAYLAPYVQYLPVPVRLNGELISRHSVDALYSIPEEKIVRRVSRKLSGSGWTAECEITIESDGRASAVLRELSVSGEKVAGQVWLREGTGQIRAFRSLFGLAPVPVQSQYALGGVANLQNLVPTAGREALSRDSIELVNRLIHLVDLAITEEIATTEMADRNSRFQQHLTTTGRYDLGRRVRVEVLPARADLPLEEVAGACKAGETRYYTGGDPTILRTFGSEGNCLLHVSASNPRRAVQLGYIRQYLKVPEVPDSPTVHRTYREGELTFAEAALAIRIGFVVAEEYFLPNLQIEFADISHNVQVLVRHEKPRLIILLARNGNAVKPLLAFYETARELFDDFVRDFVRHTLYPHFSNLVPSATRQGAEALRQVLQRNRELYRYDETETGTIEDLLPEFLAGDVTLAQVISQSAHRTRPQTQTVRKEQVGRIESEIPDVVESPVAVEPEEGGLLVAPPILRTELQTAMKLLTADGDYPQLNNIRAFLGLSDRVFRREKEFFLQPHATRVIWGGHRIVYIFTHASQVLSLYYDVELREPLGAEVTGHAVIPTTTIVTKDRVFVPIPGDLRQAFQVGEGAKEFFVRFDTLSTQG